MKKQTKQYLNQVKNSYSDGMLYQFFTFLKKLNQKKPEKCVVCGSLEVTNFFQAKGYCSKHTKFPRPHRRRHIK